MARFLTSVSLLLPASAFAHVELKPAIVPQLKSEIHANLRSSMRDRGLARPLRIFQYTVSDDENFFQIVTRFSQDPDTIASINELASPDSVQKGTVLLIPNARGLFLESAQAGCEPVKVDDRNFCFFPGRRYSTSERLYFEGDVFLHPLPGARLTSHYGTRIDPIHRKRSFHGGIDLAAPIGTAVKSTQEGTVIYSGKKGGYGKLVIVKHNHGYFSYYGHLSRIDVKKGQKVQKGTELGAVGKTGRVTGPHLHFELRKKTSRLNPLEYFKHH